MKKYELTENTISYEGTILYQIRSLADFGNIKKGDLGGWIEREENYKQDSSGWLYKWAKVLGKAVIYGGVFHDGNFYDGNFHGGNFFGGEFHGGEFYGGNYHGGHFFNGDFHGGDFHGGEFRGGEFHGGEYSKAPLQIVGSRHFVNVSNINTITIGCETHTFEFWLNNFEKIGEENGYTESEIK